MTGRALPARLQLGLAAVLLVALGLLSWHFNARPHHWMFRPLPDVLRALAAIFVVFGLTGLGTVRLLLPERMRMYELLWVLPSGACVTGLGLTVLCFAHVPYAVALALLLAGGLVLSLEAVRRHGIPAADLRCLRWPVYLTGIVLAVTLIPMVFVQHFDAITGTGSDAHVAAGVAQFLKHAYPTSVDVHQPINQMQPTWQSKYPIYYAFAAVSSVCGLATWQVMPILIGTMFALAAVGLFLVAREVFQASVTLALTAMLIAGLDRMGLHTPLNPYFNQTWGYFAMPFTLTLGWICVQRGLTPNERGRTLGLLVIFALIMVLAYPLAAPIPALPLIAFGVGELLRRRRAGEPVLPRRLPRGRRGLLWIVPVAVALAVPVAGAVDKLVQFAKELGPGAPINGSWRGDITHYFPWNWFFSLPNSAFGYVLFTGLVALALVGLVRAPRPLGIGLGLLLALSCAFAVYLRHLQAAYYIEFKLLAFTGPLLVLIGVIGAGRLPRPRITLTVAATVLLVALAFNTKDELAATGYQLPQADVELSGWAKALPRGASVRLDLKYAGEELWVAYFMDARPLCSLDPILHTDYPHVAYSRKADYILTERWLGRPADAIGPPVRTSPAYMLYRMNPKVPGPSLCSLRRYDQIYTGAGYSFYG